MASATGADTGKVAYVAEDRGYPDEKGISDSGSPTYGNHGDTTHGDVQDFSEKQVLKYALPAQYALRSQERALGFAWSMSCKS